MEMFNSQINMFDERMTQARSAAVDCEIYMDRYLPCKILNMIYNAFLEGAVFDRVS